MIHDKMRSELESKQIFEFAKKHAYEYVDTVDEQRVFPSQESLNNLRHFDEPLPVDTGDPIKILDQLQKFGAPAATAQTGGRYFGFVDGGAVPISLAAKWMTDVWDQCGGLYVISPINGKLEAVCESWLKDVLALPQETVAGFVSGTSMANLSALCAARYHVLKNLGWDFLEKGLMQAPKLRILAHQQVHASVKATFALLGFGSQNIEWLPADKQGRLDIQQLPELDNSCIVLLQAGNANTGAFDDIDAVCDLANAVGAWVHIDGAFGLWARACPQLQYLTKGMEKASSWAVDGHKTLNTPYDCGIVLCRHPESLVTALRASGEYIIYSEQRDPMLYGPEMSKRCRAIELWATMKYLGRNGIEQMVGRFYHLAKRTEAGLKASGFRMLNEVVFNQVLVACESEAQTKMVVQAVQDSGAAWLGGTTWQGQAAIRISICSWKTTEEDIDLLVSLMSAANS